MRKNTWIFILIGFSILSGCNKTNPKQALKQGDLLFQNLNCGPLCDAIEAVTEGVDGKDFSHCAMVIEINDTLFAIEAIGSMVQLTSIDDFFKRSGDTNELNRISIGRLRKPYVELIPLATQFAIQQVGKPYDDLFLLDNGKWYCSELLYESYKAANNGQALFELNRMTFKHPESQEFFPAWVDYYANLGMGIPEGEPGLNPGSISRSDKIEIINR